MIVAGLQRGLMPQIIKFYFRKWFLQDFQIIQEDGFGHISKIKNAIQIVKAFILLWTKIDTRVPQGLILGLLVFRLCVNYKLQAVQCEFYFYADYFCLLFQNKDLEKKRHEK